MDAKTYLGKIRKNEQLIKNKQREKKYWLEMATGVVGNVASERVQSSKNNHTQEQQVIEAVYIDEEIKRLKSEIAEIIATLEKLKCNEYDILFKVYVGNMTLKEISIESGKSATWTSIVHRRALKSLQELLDSTSY